MDNKVFSQMNIETLMPSNNHNYNRNTGKIDVNMISTGKSINIDPSKDFNSHNLLGNIYERRKKKRNWLVDMYNLCCNKIKDADDAGLTDITFTLPEIILENSSYRHQEALEYISKNLRDQRMDTLILDKKSIFITWKFLELRLEEELDNEKNDDNSKYE
jgi:hypothetical protein